MWNKLQILFHTIKYLKPIQIRYQIWYRLKSKYFSKKYKRETYHLETLPNWKDVVSNLKTHHRGNKFKFLNIEHQFSDEINWNYSAHKKLWTYNLNYFDFLNQKEFDKENGIQLIENYIANYKNLKDGLEPYPTSLRIINWVKFLTKHQINNPVINGALKNDANRLSDNLEYHLLANHLLENGYALWFAAHYFRNEAYLKLADQILQKELKEQILNDGAHFELSPMYHQLMLYRVLDCIRISELNPFGAEDTIELLKSKVGKMTSWLNNMTFKSGAIPLFNDAANGINPTSKDILAYAKELGFSPQKHPLKDSGYRKFSSDHYEMIVDVGEVGPSYQPGHVHADTFSFEMYYKNNPIFVDMGTSTYNIGERRTNERSTKSHNTVTVQDKNSSHVWSGFRVAKRAHILELKEQDGYLKASHDGFKSLGVIHERVWICSDDQIKIKDNLSGDEPEGIAYLHLHPSVNLVRTNNTYRLNEEIELSFKGADQIVEFEHNYSPEFNTYQNSKGFEIKFKKEFLTRLKFK